VYTIDCVTTIRGSLADVWATWSDMARYPEWDPREQEIRIDGPFRAGTTGWSKQVGRRPGSPFEIVRVEAPNRWMNESPLPGGKLVIDHLLTDNGDGTVHLVKRYEVQGPMQLAFRLIFARGIVNQAPGTFSALEAETARRAAA
jgi:uncharacterized protein YndB with AHSA1/START domain